MIAWIVDQLRMARCHHDYAVQTTAVYGMDYEQGDLPVRHMRTLICKKCGYTKRVRT